MPRRRGEPIYLPADVLERVKGYMAENGRTDLQRVVVERLLVGLADEGREANAEVEVAKRRASATVMATIQRNFANFCIEQQRELNKLSDRPSDYQDVPPPPEDG